jgi:protein-disulfide isomerase/uncharacterized membrane protein
VETSVTLRGWRWPRFASLVLGAGMAGVAAVTMRHFYEARFPASIQAAAACRADSFFNCANTALAPIAALQHVPIGFFGFMVASLLILGALFPSERLERTNGLLALVNAVLGLALLAYSLGVLRTLCFTCSGYSVLAIASGALFLPTFGRNPDGSSPLPRALARAVGPIAVFGAFMLVGAYGVGQYWEAKAAARSGSAAAKVVHQYFALDTVKMPSVLSPYWIIRSSERFEDAPIQIVEYSDLLCSDCRFFAEQMQRLAPQFPGQINLVFQPFPLEAKCNDVVEKDKHPGACDITYAATYRPELFNRIHDEVFANQPLAKKSPEWRAALAKRYGVEVALTDSATQARVRQLIRTGAEYDKTSEQYAHGIRSTPTLIVNGRMIIGTLPDEQMRAILQAVLDQRLGRGRRFIENWVE